MIAVNRGIPQVLYQGYEALTIRQNVGMPGYFAKRSAGDVQKDMLWWTCEEVKEKRLALLRTFAFGDVLMLISAVQSLRKAGYDFGLAPCGAYREYTDEYAIHAPEAVVSFDGFLELDHSVPEMSARHRIDLLVEALIGQTLPASFDVPQYVENKIKDIDRITEISYIAVQASGSVGMKRLCSGVFFDVVAALRDFGTVVVFGEKQRDVPLPCGVLDLRGKTSRSAMWSVVRGCRLLVCFDSAPLWVSHFEKRPTLCLLGPTSWEQRLTKHPLFPEKAQAIQLNEMIGCPPCFEAAGRCSGQYKCMRQMDSGKIVSAMLTVAEKLI